MKISKLFHWLYGFVMLLPIFAIGSACLISTFNMSTKDESEIIYKYQTNEVNSNDDLIVGNIYHYKVDLSSINGSDFARVGDIYNIVGKRDSSFTINEPGDYFTLYSGGTRVEILRYNPWTQLGYINVDNSYFECDVVFYGLYNTDVYSNYSSTNFNVIDYVETHNVSAQDVFYNSVAKVQQMPIFSWAYNSFLVAPFQYILVLFGVPANHVIVELLSYWLAVSIIWLVFDLIMYIPLLVHRWLDKGVLE